GLAMSYSLLVLTHLPLAVIGSIALAFYALLRLDRKKLWQTVTALVVSAAIGLAASASYWMTMIFELRWIRGDNVDPEPGLRYSENFVLSTLSAEHVNVWWMNILLLSMVAMFWPALILFTRGVRTQFATGEHRSLTGSIAALASVLLLTLFM